MASWAIGDGMAPRVFARSNYPERFKYPTMGFSLELGRNDLLAKSYSCLVLSSTCLPLRLLSLAPPLVSTVISRQSALTEGLPGIKGYGYGTKL